MVDRLTVSESPIVEYKKRIEPTKNQLKAIQLRDNLTCQYPGEHDCSEHGSVHHITPVAWALNVLDWEEEKINTPENMLYLCHNIHAKQIHNYHIASISSFGVNKKLFIAQKASAEMPLPYWDTENMYEMSVVAAYRTVVAKSDGWIFPPKSIQNNLRDVTFEGR